MLENGYPTLSPKGNAPKMQQVGMADLEPAQRQGTQISLAKKSQLRTFPPRHHNNQRSKGPKYTLQSPNIQKTWKNPNFTSPVVDEDYFPKKRPKQHTFHIQESTKHPKLLSTTTANEPIKETKRGKWGQKEGKRAYQKDVHQRTTKLTYAKTIGDRSRRQERIVMW